MVRFNLLVEMVFRSSIWINQFKYSTYAYQFVLWNHVIDDIKADSKLYWIVCWFGPGLGH